MKLILSIGAHYIDNRILVTQNLMPRISASCSYKLDLDAFTYSVV